METQLFVVDQNNYTSPDMVGCPFLYQAEGRYGTRLAALVFSRLRRFFSSFVLAE